MNQKIKIDKRQKAQIEEINKWCSELKYEHECNADYCGSCVISGFKTLLEYYEYCNAVRINIYKTQMYRWRCCSSNKKDHPKPYCRVLESYNKLD